MAPFGQVISRFDGSYFARHQGEATDNSPLSPSTIT